jgi:DNA-binding XRE family transcriptional regulator
VAHFEPEWVAHFHRNIQLGRPHIWGYYFFIRWSLLEVDSFNKEKTLKDFGKTLRKYRLEKGLSQYELHYLSELGKNAVGRIERGEVNPTLTVILELARVLEISPCKLLELTMPPPNDDNTILPK